MPDTIDYKFTSRFLFLSLAAMTVMFFIMLNEANRLQAELNASRLEFSQCSQQLYLK